MILPRPHHWSLDPNIEGDTVEIKASNVVAKAKSTATVLPTIPTEAEETDKPMPEADLDQ